MCHVVTYPGSYSSGKVTARGLLGALEIEFRNHFPPKCSHPTSRRDGVGLSDTLSIDILLFFIQITRGRVDRENTTTTVRGVHVLTVHTVCNIEARRTAFLPAKRILT